MKICGIIAEYNPFHYGHALHLHMTRAILGPDTATVCMMSGNFVQRGELSLLDKYDRAQAAVRCGADLVLELPLGAALSSAEGFARGAVTALDALHSVDYLSFGSECGSVRALRHAARLSDSPNVQHALRTALHEGLSYAAAQQQALFSVDPDAAKLLTTPNNILGIEYCRALERSHSRMTPLSVRREGAAHDADKPLGRLASASHIRALVRAEKLAECEPLLPAASFALLRRAIDEGRAPVHTVSLDAALLSRLRRLSTDMLAQYESSDDGLTNRLARAIREGTSFTNVCERAQTRRYPLSRIRRALLRAFLDIPLQSPSDTPAYLRVLAIGAQGRPLLRHFAETCHLPLLTKPAHENRQPAHLQPALDRDARADDLYALALPGESWHAAGAHFRSSPFCLRPESSQ